MKNDEHRDLFPGALEMMILRTLKRHPLHGYALAQHIKRTSNELLQIEEGSLYPALQRLLKEGLVKAEWGVSSTHRRVRTYRLTPAGVTGNPRHFWKQFKRYSSRPVGMAKLVRRAMFSSARTASPSITSTPPSIPSVFRFSRTNLADTA